MSFPSGFCTRVSSVQCISQSYKVLAATTRVARLCPLPPSEEPRQNYKCRDEGRQKLRICASCKAWVPKLKVAVSTVWNSVENWNTNTVYHLGFALISVKGHFQLCRNQLWQQRIIKCGGTFSVMSLSKQPWLSSVSSILLQKYVHGNNLMCLVLHKIIWCDATISFHNYPL